MKKYLYLVLAAAMLGLTACNSETPVTGISLSQQEMELMPGESKTLTATVLPSDADNPAITWTSSDVRIATVEQTEVTQELWQAVMGSNPSYFSGSTRLVEMVSWNDCQMFITKLNLLTGKTFRLPTEAEWEYAARGGNKSKGYIYSGSNTIGDVAWYDDTSSSTTHDVATKSPNELGIYDMSGNVWEWCQDWYELNYYSSSPVNNPMGPTSGSDRVYRGGSWNYIATYCRVAKRSKETSTKTGNYLGFRLAQ